MFIFNSATYCKCPRHGCFERYSFVLNVKKRKRLRYGSTFVWLSLSSSTVALNTTSGLKFLFSFSSTLPYRCRPKLRGLYFVRALHLRTIVTGALCLNNSAGIKFVLGVCHAKISFSHRSQKGIKKFCPVPQTAAQPRSSRLPRVASFIKDVPCTKFCR